MDKNNKKILTMCYLAVAGLTAFSTGLLIEAFASIIPGLATITTHDFVQHGLPIVLGLAVFFGLQFNTKVNVYFDEVITEIKKIVWPSRRDTTAMTIVVCVIVVIAGFCLAIFDGVSGYMVGQLSKIPLP
jgi:preprotein translocase subunit SecE